MFSESPPFPKTPAAAPPLKWNCLDFALVPYEKAWELQRQLVQARITGALETDTLMLLEHPPVFTLGRSASREHILVSEDFLKKSRVPVLQTERGGNITWHGPGQMMAYPIVDLRKNRLRAGELVRNLEEVMIRIAAEWGVAAQRDPRNRGVWIGNNKLGSVGIAVRRGVSFHGCALNVSPSLAYFEWIRPCGLEGIGVTTLARESSRAISMEDVRSSARRHFAAVFGITLETMEEKP